MRFARYAQLILECNDQYLKMTRVQPTIWAQVCNDSDFRHQWQLSRRFSFLLLQILLEKTDKPWKTGSRYGSSSRHLPSLPCPASSVHLCNFQVYTANLQSEVPGSIAVVVSVRDGGDIVSYGPLLLPPWSLLFYCPSAAVSRTPALLTLWTCRLFPSAITFW